MVVVDEVVVGLVVVVVLVEEVEVAEDVVVAEEVEVVAVASAVPKLRPSRSPPTPTPAVSATIPATTQTLRLTATRPFRTVDPAGFPGP